MVAALKPVDLPFKMELPIGCRYTFMRPACTVATNTLPGHNSVLRRAILARFITEREGARGSIRNAASAESVVVVANVLPR